MKPVFIIAIVAVALIGVMVPSVFADQEQITITPISGSGSGPGCELTEEGCFSPNHATVDVGGVVIFYNTDNVLHTFTSGIPSDDIIGTEFNSGMLSPGDSAEWKPENVGSFPYFDMIFPWMKGTIIVQEAENRDVSVEETGSPPTSNSQTIISNFDLQEKLDEYWYCTVELGYSNQDCVKHDEKHTVGISPTEIANYQIEKDDTLTFTYEDSDISTKLETFRDQSLHQDLWEIYTSITPPEILSEVVYFVVYTDDYGGAESASVQRDPDNFLKFDLFVDPVDMVPSGIKLDKQFYISTLIHENAHILSLGASQSDNKPMSDDVNSPDMYIQEMKNGERSCAPNYYNDLVGCMNQNSYLNAFFQKFWAGIYHDFKWELEFDDYETFYEHDIEFYNKYEKYWLTEYSSVNPDEDFAESFMAFVLKEKPSAPTFAEQKILFFYQYPELVEMRDFTRSAIATSEFCDNGTVWKDEKCQQSVSPPPQQQPQQSESGGCLIATATYGSEMAIEVQQLRELRDNQLLQTESGKQFMGMFNDIYYSFSPYIADMERESPLFKEAVKLAITPMISTLSLMDNANSESEVLGIGISVIMLNLGMYLGVPAIVIIGIRRKF